MKRDSFIFYRSFWEALKRCPNDVRLQLCEAIIEYALDFKKPKLEGLAKIIFTLIEAQIEANNRKYAEGKKGGRSAKCQRKNETTQYQQFLKDGRWQRRRLEIMERDGFKCCDCGTSDDLHVHHIQYIAGRKPWEYDDEDLITLCEKCHKKRHK